MKKQMIIFLGTVLMAIGLPGCGPWCDDCGGGHPPGPSKPTPLSLLQLEQFASCEDYKGYIASSLAKQHTQQEDYAWRGDLGNPAIMEDVALSDGESSSGSVPDRVSQTNVQVEGVDEADVVKTATDGTMYIANGGFLTIVDGFPPDQMATLATVVTDIPASELYLDEENQRLVLIGQHGYGTPEMALDAEYLDVAIPGAGYAGVRVVFFDVSDPRDPIVTRELHLEGHHISSRRIGDRVHLISGYTPVTLATLSRELGYGGEEKLVRRDALTRLEDVNSIELLPRATLHYLGGQEPVTLVTCSDVYRPQVQQQISHLVVTSFDTDGANLSGTSVLNSGWITYANFEHLYIAQTSYGWWWDVSQRAQTVVHKFAIGEETPAYFGSGVVPGWIPDSFALDEYEQRLRVISHVEDYREGSEEWVVTNALHVLEQQGEALTTVASVPEFGNNENLHATRLMGDRGFAVTFRQTDPLFAFDLSDPYDPKIVGELHIPGFSEYMHPLGNGYLLTVGQEGEGTRLTGRVQLQIFDVRDLSDPQVAFKYTPEIPNYGSSWSAALYDRHAFTFDDEAGILALPLTYSDYNSGSYFAGIVAFRVDAEDGIEELGRVDHSDLAQEVYCANPVDEYVAEECQYGGWIWGAAPSRSVLMALADESYLYSISRIGVKATHITDANQTLSSLTLPSKGYGWWWY